MDNKSGVKPFGPSTTRVRIVLWFGVVAIVGIVGFLVYRSIGFVAANRSYNCVEDTIYVVDEVNMLVDVEEGVFIEDAALIVDELNTLRAEIADNEECLTGMPKMAAGTLSEMQLGVDEAALEYIDAVILMAEGEADPNQALLQAVSTYKLYLDARADYETELDEVERRFLLAL